MSLRALLVLLLAVCSVTACKTKPKKGSAALYQGDAPTVHYYDEPEEAGGAMRTKKYR